MSVRAVTRADTVVAACPGYPWRRPVRIVDEHDIETYGCRVCLAITPCDLDIGHLTPARYETLAEHAEHLELAHEPLPGIR
jgi:hypothetical protein